MTTMLSAGNVPASEVITTETDTLGVAFISSVIFLANGQYVVGSGLEGKIHRWKTDDGRRVGKLMNVGDTVLYSLATSRDGRWIVSGMETGSVVIWNAENHSRVRQFMAHREGYPVRTVDVSPDGTRIATGSRDSTACVWSFSTGARLFYPLEHDFELAAVKFLNDGRLLATATSRRHSVRIYDGQDGHLLVNVLVKVDGDDQSLAWSINSKYLYALSDANIVRLDVATGTTLSEWPIHSIEEPKSIILASNGRFIAACANKTVSFWDTTTEMRIGIVVERPQNIFSMDISSNYDLVTTGIEYTIIQSLRGILPSHYCSNLPCEPEIERTETDDGDDKKTIKLLLTEIRSLRMQHERSYKKIARLEDTVEALRLGLTKAQGQAERATNKLSMAIESLRDELVHGTED